MHDAGAVPGSCGSPYLGFRTGDYTGWAYFVYRPQRRMLNSKTKAGSF